MRIFIVEDSPFLQERLIQRFAKDRKIRIVGTAGEADSAIEQIQELKPDVAILDIRLRQGNGLKVLQAIKTAGPLPVIVVLTNFAYPQYRQEFIANGADYFFDKSTEFDQAIQVIQELSQTKKRDPGSVARKRNPKNE